MTRGEGDLGFKFFFFYLAGSIGCRAQNLVTEMVDPWEGGGDFPRHLLFPPHMMFDARGKVYRRGNVIFFLLLDFFFFK